MHFCDVAHLSFRMVPLAIAVDTGLTCPLATPVRLPFTHGPWTRANPQHLSLHSLPFGEMGGVVHGKRKEDQSSYSPS